MAKGFASGSAQTFCFAVYSVCQVFQFFKCVRLAGAKRSVAPLVQAKRTPKSHLTVFKDFSIR